MSTNLKNGKLWSREEVRQLKALAHENTPTRIIAMKMGRTPSAIQSKASAINVSLKPANQSPYTKRGA
jgi:hypothetical protein